jgi:ADP-ribosylglycohydrolase
MAAGIAQAVRGATPEMILKYMVAAAAKYDKQTAAMMTHAIALAKINKPKLSAYTTLRQQVLQIHNPVFEKYLGWLAHDAIAATVYIFALYPDDVAKAIYLGVHTPGDSDSIASMAGALVGARVGYTKVEQAFAADIARLENVEVLKQLAQLAAA